MTPQEAIYELAEICLVRCDGEPSENRYDAGFFATEVDAWQPLPEPWEGEQK